MVSVATSSIAALLPRLEQPGTVLEIARDQPITLQVSGGKPVRLRGQVLAEGQSWSPGTVAWHEVTLYRTDAAEIAVAVRTLRKARGETDVHRAELFPTLADALSWLEEFDPTQDLSVDLDASDRALSTIEIALRAAALRGRADEVARQWRALLGELLFRLDASA
jgi:hypothetical protein